eukprot:gnl/MRDRNA2_/MRDRNA2_69722_c0_seq1.p1 gnl/MRDRNA2_/MRDRNA2_69722_c0~~gnl/MRDRNA2_/MRDRNA2_69722_c0_seq1.p1  ORF type:complete len:794 (+),score=150.62 gnl/MRDRNA2_/MRDRNA2_69722_c0_seq1:86-2467(+)
MRRISSVILLSFTAHVLGTGSALPRWNKLHKKGEHQMYKPVDKLVDKLVGKLLKQTLKDKLLDKLVNKLFDPTLKDKVIDELVNKMFDHRLNVSPLHGTDVEYQTLGKSAIWGGQHSSRLALPRHATPVLSAHPSFKSSWPRQQPYVQSHPFLRATHKSITEPTTRYKAPTTVVRSSTTDVVEVEAPPTDEVKAETKVPIKPPRSALQIVEVNRDTDEVNVRKDNLQLIQDNLVSEGVDRISIVSVMGAYRTGKSFLLDLMRRYLEYESLTELQNKTHVAAQPELQRELGEQGGRYQVPAWLEKGENLEREGGFAWREGQDACTEGVWIYSKPYVKEATVMEGPYKNETRRIKIGILLMDTQGAWDSKMTPQQSATIFGLTTALSSKQIFNIQNRIGKDSIKALDYFANTALAAERLMRQQGRIAAFAKQPKSELRPFQELQVLVRDWVNFDDNTWQDAQKRRDYSVSEQVVGMQRWPVDACLKQMDLHFQDQFGPESRDRKAVDSLYNMFNKLSAFLLPLPGKDVQRSWSWSGDIADIDEDFMRFLDLFMVKTFSSDLTPQQVMGQDLSPNRFAEVVGGLAEAFSGMGFTADTMVEAIGRATNLLSQDAAMKLYRKEMDRILNDPVKVKNMELDEVEAMHLQAREAAIREFTGNAIFGESSEIRKSKKKLKKKLESSWQDYREKFKRRMAEALNFLAPAASIGLLLFATDRLSDFTCDWWSSSCVDFSNAAFDLYAPLLAAIVGYIFFTYKDENAVTTSAAVLGLQKEIILFIQDRYRDISKLIKDQMSQSQ